MRASRIARASAAPDQLLGRVLCHELRAPDGAIAIPKGCLLGDDDVARAMTLEWPELHVMTLDPGDVHEDAAGARLAHLVAGEGIAVRAHSGGHWQLAATERGVLAIDAVALADVNALDGPCVHTLLDGQIVDRGDVVARAKVLPFAVPETVLQDAGLAAGGGIIGVASFRPRRVGAVVHGSLGERAIARFQSAIAEKLAWFGSSVGSIAIAASSASDIAAAFRAVRAAGNEVVLVAGTKAMDALDPTFSALEEIGARMVRRGVPAHPGSLLWVATWDDLPVIGMPTCGLFAQATVFDIVIGRLLSEQRIGARELALLGHGGLLTRDMAYRLPPYRSRAERGAVE